MSEDIVEQLEHAIESELYPGLYEDALDEIVALREQLAEARGEVAQIVLWLERQSSTGTGGIKLARAMLAAARPQNEGE